MWPTIYFITTLVLAVAGDTVYFTNSQDQLKRSLRDDTNTFTKTYQLEVPGSDPITIIEADPVDARKPRKTNEYEEIKTKDYIVPGSTHEQEDRDGARCYGPSCRDSSKKVVYSPELLNKFLKEYAEKIKNADQNTKEKLLQMESGSQEIEEGIIVSDKGGYQKKKITDRVDIQTQTQSHKDGNRKVSGWDEINAKRHNHPHDDRDGWVALEAIPWTKSKISKWKPNAQKFRPTSSYTAYEDEKEIDRYSSHGHDYPSKYQNNRPHTSSNHFQSSLGEDYDIPHYSSWTQDEPTKRPPWSKIKPQNTQNYDYDSGSKHDCNHPSHGDSSYNRRVSKPLYESNGIITDGQGADFPSIQGDKLSAPGYFRRPTQIDYSETSNDEHPSTYPVNGNGEWVLLSTTRGYQVPQRKRQRSMTITPSTSLTSHRSVRLTVLPAVDGSKENMTTSHGGLLEVEPSFQTVEESRMNAQKKNKTKVRGVRLKNVVSTPAQTDDGSAVLAAVGAGLVPATMAMIMPMVVGRKRRDLRNYNSNSYYYNLYQNVTKHPLNSESTLQRSL